MRNISLNAHYIVLFKSPRDKQQISMLARQVNPGKVQEFMRSYEDATRRPHGYLMLDLKPTTDDQQRLKTNVLPGEIAKFLHKQSYRQPPLVNAMYDAEQRMKEIMDAPQLSAVEKSKLYSDQLNWFLKSCVNFCPQSLAPDFKAYTRVINNAIHLVMQIRIALIPLITYTS